MPTITQAKTMWCPMVRHPDSDGGSYNRGVKNDNPINADHEKTPPLSRGYYGCHCISTQCMMWRWTVPARPEYSLEPLDEATRDGYCGLAGSGRV